ncbi:hypothetical protein [Streptomyces sp. 3213.3]|uniref:hypothetical protein n=1 Tax=Streptomyces sp. 3213.3 TaxID=1855348 RepID=UPI001F30CC17|nr:hypothetical protein [Streptomyces sp. 3213.3]
MAETTAPQDLAAHYIGQWTEPDRARRAVIEGLWAEDGTHVLQPPAEIRELAAGLGFDHPTLRPARPGPRRHRDPRHP